MAVVMTLEPKPITAPIRGKRGGHRVLPRPKRFGVSNCRMWVAHDMQRDLTGTGRSREAARRNLRANRLAA